MAGDKVIPRLANLCLEVIYTVPELSQQLMDMDNALDMAAFRLPIPVRFYMLEQNFSTKIVYFLDIFFAFFAISTIFSTVQITVSGPDR